jgi:hypothetical protein
MTMAQPNAALVDALVALDPENLLEVVNSLLERQPTPKRDALLNALYDKLEDKRAGHAEPPTYEELRDRAGRNLVRAEILQDRLRRPATLSPQNLFPISTKVSAR